MVRMVRMANTYEMDWSTTAVSMILTNWGTDIYKMNALSLHLVVFFPPYRIHSPTMQVHTIRLFAILIIMTFSRQS